MPATLKKRDDACLALEGELDVRVVNSVLDDFSLWLSTTKSSVIEMDLQAVATVHSVTVAFLLECMCIAKQQGKALVYSRAPAALLQAIAANGVAGLIVMKD